MNASIQRAAGIIGAAKALMITAGAGLGVDSGLPDFRGPEGFWRAYPPLARLGLHFEDIAQPDWFHHDPALAWGFYGHRLNLYRATTPHRGFALLKRWGLEKPGGMFVYTSNVDGQFQVAGFDEDEIVECHGSIRHLQCTAACGQDIWLAPETRVEVDEATIRATSPLPECPRCGGLARPNILMFNDGAWDMLRTHQQHDRLQRWLHATSTRDVAVIELGAGTSIPSVRHFSESLARHGAHLVRINPREPRVPAGHVSLVMPALAALEAIEAALAGGSQGYQETT